MKLKEIKSCINRAEILVKILPRIGHGLPISAPVRIYEHEEADKRVSVGQASIKPG